MILKTKKILITSKTYVIFDVKLNLRVLAQYEYYI